MLRHIVSALAVMVLSCAAAAQPLTTAFTYQGELTSSGTPAAGAYDFRFLLFDGAGTQLGATLCSDNVAVVNGTFTVQLDFGTQFAGQQRFLEIWVRQDTGLNCSSSTGYTVLSPRQALTAAPNSMYAVTAGTATTAGSATSSGNAAQLNGQAGSFYSNAANLVGTLPSGTLSGSYTGVLSFTNSTNSFSGSGAGLQNLNGTNISTGTISNARTTGTSANTAGALVLRDAAGSFSAGTMTGTFSGDGSLLSNIAAGAIATGTLANARTTGTSVSNPNTLVLRDASGGFSGNVVSAGLFSGDGSGLLNLNAASIASGTVPDARLSTNIATLSGIQTFTGGKTFSGDTYFGSRVGVGTTTPGMTVEVTTPTYNGNPALGVASGARYVYLQTGPTDGSVTWNSGAALRFGAETSRGTGYVELARITSSGAVGIGTATPGSRLDVRNSGSGHGAYSLNGIASGNTDSNYAAVWGDTNAGNGVVGTSSGPSFAGGNGHGVLGIVSGTGFAAVEGDCVNTNYAGYFSGRVNVTGTLSKGGGSFKIDHPLDPENKFLYHSFVESPDMKNIYDGTATTDERGYATIQLPAWFGELNRDLRYQLTVIDESDTDAFVQAKVVREIKDNEFTIRTSLPGVKVSWQVTGIRQDAFANAHRIPVEEDKSEAERGKLLYPVEQGQPAERGIDFQRRNGGPVEAPGAARP